jgi:hypothetical protein
VEREVEMRDRKLTSRDVERALQKHLPIAEQLWALEDELQKAGYVYDVKGTPEFDTIGVEASWVSYTVNVRLKEDVSPRRVFIDINYVRGTGYPKWRGEVEVTVLDTTNAAGRPSKRYWSKDRKANAERAVARIADEIAWHEQARTSQTRKKRRSDLEAGAIQKQLGDVKFNHHPDYNRQEARIDYVDGSDLTVKAQAGQNDEVKFTVTLRTFSVTADEVRKLLSHLKDIGMVQSE